MNTLYVDPDITKAETLSTDFYTSPEYFAKAKEKIFKHTWSWLADISNLTTPGDVYPADFHKPMLDEPMLITRGHEGSIHCLSNVCTHRGATLVDQRCQLTEIQCPYHGRRFSTEGKFLSMPEFGNVKNFPRPADDLTRVKFHTIGTWLFATLHHSTEATPFFDDMMRRTAWMPWDRLVYREDLSNTFTLDAHWALYCENYLEGFHIPFVHKQLNQVIQFKNYTTILFPYSNLQLALAKENEVSFSVPPSATDYGKDIAAYYFFIFPNMMFNIYPWGISVNIVQPHTPDKTSVHFYTYVWNESLLERGAGANLHDVEMEDEAIVLRVQRGVRSSFYTHGRYSPSREQGVHHFHRLIAAFMA